MHWRIESKARDGLKVIREIPDIPTCLIEGRNGVGKTVAVQLLELVSGEIPDDFRRRPALWSSLGKRLGATSVLVDGLRNGQRLNLTFTPAEWDTEVPTSVGEWLGTAEIDGKPASVKDCSDLVAVTRIAGNEDLEETLKRRVDTLSVYLDSAARTLRDRGDLIDGAFSEIGADLERADPVELAADEARLAQLEEELARAEGDAAEADRRLHRLLKASETKRHLDAADQATEEMLARRDELVAEVKRLASDLASKETLAEAAEKALAAEGDAQKKLADAEKLLRHRNSRLANLEREVDNLARRLGVRADQERLAVAVAACEDRIRELAGEHRELDAMGVVRDLIDEIVAPLEGAKGLAGEQVLIRNDGLDLTVAETLAGLGRRRSEILDRPQPAQLRELATELAAVKQRGDQLREASAKLEQHSQQHERVEQAATEAEQAAEQAEQASEAAVRSREANQAVGGAQVALSDAHRELAEVQEQIGSAGLASREDADADLRQSLAELGLGADDLASAEGTARTAVAEADRKVSDIVASVTAVRRRLTTRRTDIDLLIERLQASQRYGWLVTATPELADDLAAPDRRYEAFGALRHAVMGASARAQDAASFLTGLVGTAQEFFTERGSNANERELKQSLRPAFEAVLAHRLRETLNSAAIRDAIFDGSEIVGIEPGTRQLTLRDQHGAESKRPMEAFSTGERAFAFTQARIADLEVSAKPNRLLVLDEFGAFVAADRLPDLADFLANDAARVADQVVVILPLHVNYEAEIGETRGALHERYAERLKQITDRGYCAVPLE